jgi:spermidine/putrescine transport system ATP-binding protein
MLTVTDIYKDYEGKPLLCGVSFEVAEHEIVSLLGASGSGKSTLLRIIAGLEPAASGQVCWQAQDLADTPVHKRQFGLMFQDYALFPHRSVAQNVAFGLRMQNLPKEEVEQRTQEALVMVHMQDFADRRVSDLSGGEQQRVALARSLAPRPRLLMLDEPLGALDHELRERLIVELRQILTQAGIPAIYVTHDHEEAYAIADRLLLLHDGVIKQQGAPQEVFQQPADVWVANFFGMGNLLAGAVISTEPLQVETALGVFEAAAPAQPDFNKGEQVQVLLRPAAAQFGDGVNSLTVRVADVRFRGDHFEVRGETGAEISLRFFSAQEVLAGDSLRIHFPAESVQVLAE